MSKIKGVIFISDNFFYFMLGVLFISVIVPAIDEIVQILLTLLELLKGKIMVPITKINCAIKKITDESDDGPKQQVYPMGFATMSEDEEEEDLDDEDV